MCRSPGWALSSASFLSWSQGAMSTNDAGRFALHAAPICVRSCPGVSLVQAASDGNLALVKEHVEAARACTHSGGACECKCFHTRDGGDSAEPTALMAAAKAGHVDVVQALLQQSSSGYEVNVTARDKEKGQTALSMAAGCGKEAVVASLLADVSVYSRLNVLIGLRDFAGKTPLVLAAEKGHGEIVKLLMAAKAGVGKCSPVDVEAALTLAAEGGHVDVVELLLGAEGVSVNSMDANGETALMLAAEAGHGSVVKLLLEAEANVNVASLVDGLTALMKAAENGRRNAVELLLGVGVDVSAKRRKIRRRGKKRGEVEVHGGGGENALMLAAARGHDDIVETLLSHGADAGIKTIDGRTDALTLALKLDDWAIARMLVEAGGTDVNGALMWGVENNSYPAVRWMESLGADVNKMEGGRAEATPLFVAAATGKREIASFLVTKGADVQGAFACAAFSGNCQAVKLLHTEGADLDEPAGFLDEPPLVIAVNKNDKDTVKYLISAGADVNARSGNQWRALEYARRGGLLDMELLLLANGADNRR